MDLWRKWRRFRKHFQAKGSSAAHLPYHIHSIYNTVGQSIASVSNLAVCCLESDISAIDLPATLYIPILSTMLFSKPTSGRIGCVAPHLPSPSSNSKWNSELTKLGLGMRLLVAWAKPYIKRNDKNFLYCKGCRKSQLRRRGNRRKRTSNRA